MCQNKLKEKQKNTFRCCFSRFIGFFVLIFIPTCPNFFLLQAGEHEVYGSGGTMEKDDSLQPRLSATGTGTGYGYCRKFFGSGLVSGSALI